jgi:tetratricopeptide (TPR) repeat protein
VDPPTWTQPADALAWYETELPALLACARQAERADVHDIAAQIAAAMWDFFQRVPYPQEWIEVSELGVRSARHLGDTSLLAWLLACLGGTRNMTGHVDAARECLAEALAIRRRSGDRPGEAAVLNMLGIGLTRAGRYAEALEYLESAADIYASLSTRLYLGLVLSNTGPVLLGLKRHDDALDCLHRALAIIAQTGEQHGMGLTESNLGDTYLDLGRLDEAVAHYRRALAALDDTEIDHEDQAGVLVNLGQALARLDRPDEARQAWQTALPILDRLGDPRAARLREDLAGSPPCDQSDSGAAKP